MAVGSVLQWLMMLLARVDVMQRALPDGLWPEVQVRVCGTASATHRNGIQRHADKCSRMHLGGGGAHLRFGLRCLLPSGVSSVQLEIVRRSVRYIQPAIPKFAFRSFRRDRKRLLYGLLLQSVVPVFLKPCMIHLTQISTH